MNTANAMKETEQHKHIKTLSAKCTHSFHTDSISNEGEHLFNCKRDSTAHSLSLPLSHLSGTTEILLKRM